MATIKTRPCKGCGKLFVRLRLNGTVIDTTTCAGCERKQRVSAPAFIHERYSAANDLPELGRD